MLRGENVEVRIECVKLQLKIVFLLTQAIDSHKNGRRFHKFRNDRNTCQKFQSTATVTKQYLGPKGAMLQYALFFIFTVVSLPVFTIFNTLEQILTSNRRKLSVCISTYTIFHVTFYGKESFPAIIQTLKCYRVYISPTRQVSLAFILIESFVMLERKSLRGQVLRNIFFALLPVMRELFLVKIMANFERA